MEVEPVNKSKDNIEVDVTGVSVVEYEEPTSEWMKFYRSSLFQMFVLGALSFCGPSMQDAITGLGGGGLAEPFVANLVTSINYALSACITLCGGPILNKIGIRNGCIIGASCFAITGSAYYVNSKYGIQWYLLLSGVTSGITLGMLYVSESTAMLSYPHANQRGRYLGIWIGARSLGSLVGGSVSLGKNFKSSGGGGVSTSTYLIFIVFEVIGFPTAFLLSPSSKVRRSDGTPVNYQPGDSWAEEFKGLWKQLKLSRTIILIIPSVYSFFYGGVFNTYLALHFSVRARALSSFLTPTCTIIGCFVYGHFILDNKRWGQKKRAWIGFFAYFIPQVAAFVWITIEYKKLYAKPSSFRLDWTTAGWAEAYLPYLLMQVTGYFCQMYLYYLISCYSSEVKTNARAGGLFRCFETIGQSVSYGINSNVGDKHIPLYIDLVLCALAIIPQIWIIRTVPEFSEVTDGLKDDQDAPADAEKAVMAAL